MPTPLEQAEKRLQEVTGQISHIATQQVAISTEIAKIKPELDKLRAEKETALAELEQIKASIEAKRNEVQSDLNQRAGQIEAKRFENENESARLSKLNFELLELEKAVDFRIEQARIMEASNKTAGEENDNLAVELTAQKAIVESRADELSAKMVNLEEVRSNAEKAIAEYKEKAKILDHQNERSVAMEKEYIDAKEQLLISQAAVNKEAVRLDALDDELKRQQEEIIAKIAKSEEADKVYENQIRTLNDIRNELKLFQAEVNDKIRKNKIEMDLKALAI